MADKPSSGAADIGKAVGKKAVSTVAKKSGAAVGAKLGGDGGGTAGGLVGAAAGVVATKGLRELPKDGAKMGLGMVTGKGIDYGTKYLVTRTAERAAMATAAEAGKAGMKLAAAQGARAAASGGFASMAGELGGGFVGKKVGRKLAKRMHADKEKGGMIGQEVGSVAGAAGAGGAFGAMVAGPVGAAGGAAFGVAGYGIGKATGAVIDKASDFQGISLVKPTLETGKKSNCSQDEAACCIVTEESPGLGKCFIYFYQTTDQAQKDFQKWWCSRILFAMQEGRLVHEIERAGWPWNQANMLRAVSDLWAVIIRRPPGIIKWTAAGVAEAERADVSDFLGNPVAGDDVTDDQIEAFALASETVEHFAELGYIEIQGPSYTWTAKGIADAADAGVSALLQNPSVGDTLTDQQVAEFAESGTTLDQIVALGYVEKAAVE